MNFKQYTLHHWYLSALFYRFTYNKISHQLDDEMFTFLGERIKGAFVADFGCGPGIVSEKFLKQGISKIIAIDANPAMLSQIKRRLSSSVDDGTVITICQAFGESLFNKVYSDYGSSLDIILFKRSLYNHPKEARSILSSAAQALAPGGFIIVVHPERSLRRYAFGPYLKVMPHTIYHLFNRTISLLGDRLHIGRYTTYSQAELQAMMGNALPSFQIMPIPSAQHAFNLVAALKPEQTHRV